MNMILIVGRISQDAEVRYTAGGQPCVNLSVATNEPRGNGREVTQWHRVTVFGDWVPQAAPRWKKGTEIFIMGKMQTRSYEDRDGAKRESTEIIAKTIKTTGEKESAPERVRTVIPTPIGNVIKKTTNPAGSPDPFDETGWIA